MRHQEKIRQSSAMQERPWPAMAMMFSTLSFTFGALVGRLLERADIEREKGDSGQPAAVIKSAPSKTKFREVEFNPNLRNLE